jgi:hypothetical protein
MRLTSAGKPDSTLEELYKLIGKPAFSETTLKDLKYAAQALGFTAEGRRLAVKDLHSLSGYAILPVKVESQPGVTGGHFVLVKGEKGGYILVVDPRTLRTLPFPTNGIADRWSGVALVITPGRHMTPFEKVDDDIASVLTPTAAHRYDELKDFGVVDSGIKVMHSFSIPAAAGNADRPVIAAKSCSCVVGAIEPDPQGRWVLKMELDVLKPAWQEAYVVLRISPTTLRRYGVRAYGRESYQFQPTIGYIPAPTGGVVDYAVTLRYFTDAGDTADLAGLGPESSNLNIKRANKSRQVDGAGVTFLFDLTLSYDAGAATERVTETTQVAYLILRTGRGERKIPYTLHARIGTAHQKATPEALFATVRDAQALVTLKTRVDFLEGPSPSEIRARMEGIPTAQAAVTRISERSYLVEVKASASTFEESPGLRHGELKVFSEDTPVAPLLTVPVSIFVIEH